MFIELTHDVKIYTQNTGKFRRGGVNFKVHKCFLKFLTCMNNEPSGNLGNSTAIPGQKLPLAGSVLHGQSTSITNFKSMVSKMVGASHLCTGSGSEW